MQDKLKLTEGQKCALVESRNKYLLNIGFHSASLARLQSQLMASLDPSTLLVDPMLAKFLSQSVTARLHARHL